MALPIVAAVCLLTGCTPMPRPDTAPRPSHSSDASPRVPAGFDLQGHRGARGLLPENTVPGFLRALELGVTTLEMDVVISQDGFVVVSHDPQMSHEICTHPSGEPVTEDEEARLVLYQMLYAEITEFDCGRRGHPRFPRQEPKPAEKPLLRAVIAAAEAYADTAGRPAPFYNIETKARPEGDGRLHPEPEPFARAVLKVVAAKDVAQRTTLQSFDPRTLRAARRLIERGEAPPVRLALLAAQETSEGLAADVEALGFAPDIYSPDVRLVDEALVEDAHARGLQVIPWTVNDEAVMQQLQALGVDGLITDYPDLGQQLLNPQAKP